MLLLPVITIVVYASTFDKRSYASVSAGALNFVKTYLCGHTQDEDSVVSAVLAIQEIPDILPEECLEFSHEPKQRHLASGVDEVVVVDNKYVVPIITPGTSGFSVASWAHGDSAYTPTHDGVGKWVDASEIADVGVGQVPRKGSVAMCSNISKPSQTYVLCQDVVEVKNHRRIGTHLHEQYVRSVVATLKVTFGCPQDNAANNLAVRRSAKHLMVRHTVRHTDIARIIDRVVAGVFIPNEYELFAAKMKSSNTTKELRRELNNARPQSFWQKFWHPFSRGRQGLEEKV